jgi:hypothetical protein
VYLWWRTAWQEEGYLEQHYKDHGIGWQRTDGDDPNFNPVIRLIWSLDELDPTTRVTVSQWNKALQSIHQHYEECPDNFAHNAAGKLVRYIQANGGVDGLRGAKSDRESQTTLHVDVESTNPVTPATPNTSNAAPDLRKLGPVALAEFKKQKEGIGTAELKHAARIGRDGFTVLLARKQAGGFIVHGSSNDPEQIETVAARAATKNLANLPANLRVIVETIATQAFPPHALPSSPEQRSKWLRTEHADRSNLRDNGSARHRQNSLQPFASVKRLLLRGQRDILFSRDRVGVSTVTRCQPKKPLIDQDVTLSLRETDRLQIERWLETGEAAWLRAEPGRRLVRSGEPGTYELALITSIASDFCGALKFHDLSGASEAPHCQAEFRRADFQADWSVKLPAEWFAGLRERWAGRWFAELGRFNQIVRPHNRSLLVKVTTKHLTLVFNRHAGQSAEEQFFFPTSINAAKDSHETSYFSKDLGPALYNLADADIVGDLTMSGNKDALLFRYDTPIGEFEIAIPTLDPAEKYRNTKLFFPYGKEECLKT